jgi:hypothetical protein
VEEGEEKGGQEKVEHQAAVRPVAVEGEEVVMPDEVVEEKSVAIGVDSGSEGSGSLEEVQGETWKQVVGNKKRQKLREKKKARGRHKKMVRVNQRRLEEHLRWEATPEMKQWRAEQEKAEAVFAAYLRGGGYAHLGTGWAYGDDDYYSHESDSEWGSIPT